MFKRDSAVKSLNSYKEEIMEVYFDNSATTRCYDSVKDVVVKTMTEDFGNPSAMHLKGVEAEKYVKEAAKTIAGILKVQEKEILFTLHLLEAYWQTDEMEIILSLQL